MATIPPQKTNSAITPSNTPVITHIQVEGNDVVSFLNGTNYVRAMSQILPQNPAYISYRYDTITISQVAGESFTFRVYDIEQVGGVTFVKLTYQDTQDVVQAKTVEIYRLLATSIFKGCCECGNTEPECSIQYTAGNGVDTGTFLYDTGGNIRVNYFTANNQDFTGFWPIIQDGSWIFVFSKTDPTVYGVYQLSNYSDGGPGVYAQFDATLLNGPGEFPEGTTLCVDVTSVGGSLVQDWQDTLNISSLLTQDNLIDGGGFDFEWENVNRYILNSTNYQTYTADDGAGNVGFVDIQPSGVNLSGTGFIQVTTPGYASATTGMVLTLTGAGYVEYAEAGTGTISSIELIMPPAFTVSDPNPLTTDGTFTVTVDGTEDQYINGLGELADFPVYTVQNGLHPKESPLDPFVFHLGGQLIEDTIIDTNEILGPASNNEWQFAIRANKTAPNNGQDSQFPFGVANLGSGGVATFQDFGSGFRPNPSVEIIGEADLFEPLLELRMEGNLPNPDPILADRIALLRLKYDGDPALAKMSIDYQFKNDDVSPNPIYFIGGRLTTEVTNFTANDEQTKFTLQLFDNGSRQNKLEMSGPGQLKLNTYVPGAFVDNTLSYVLAVNSTGEVFRKLATTGGTVQEVSATGLLTTSPDPITVTGTVSSEMNSGFLVGRYSSGLGVFQEITVGAGLDLSAAGVLTADGSVPVYTVDNGLSPDPGDPYNFQLGGPLVQDTTITGGTVPFTNYLHIDNLNGFSLDVNNKGYLISENGDDKSQFIFTKVYASSRYENNLTGELAEISVGGDSGISDVNAFLRAATVFGETGIYAGVVPGILPYTANMLGVKTPKVANGTATVGQVLTLKSMTGSEAGRVEFEDAAPPGATYDSNQGIYKDTSLTNDTFQLGAPSGLQTAIPFSVDRYIYTKYSSLTFEGIPDNQNIINVVGFTGTNVSRGVNVDYTNSSKSTAFYAAISNSGVGLEVASSGTGFDIKQIGSSKLTTNAPVPGIALALEILNPSNTASGDGVKINLLANTIESYYTNATGESNLRFAVRPDGVSSSINSLELDGTLGQVIFNQYGQTPAVFPDASPVWALGVDASGNVVEFDPGGSGPTYTVDNGLTENPANNFQLGGLLLTDTTIDGDGNTYSLAFDGMYIIGGTASFKTSFAVNDGTTTSSFALQPTIANIGCGVNGSGSASFAEFTDTQSRLGYLTPTQTIQFGANATGLYVKTPDVAAAAATVGQVLTLQNATTGEAEWQDAPGGGGIPFGVATGTDTYAVSAGTASTYTDGDAYLVRFTNGNTGASTLNVNGAGAANMYSNSDGLLIGGDIWAESQMLCVYDSSLPGFKCIGTSTNSLFAYVTNAEATTITKGMAVYAAGGTGDRMTVKKALATGDSTSALTVGMVFADIAAGQKGIILIQGELVGLNLFPTSGGGENWVDGDPVYLSATTAGAVTRVKQYAPNHLVYLGICVKASNGTAGRMYVRIQNGYELDELHNVQAQTPANKDTLWYDNSVSPKQWKTASVPSLSGTFSIGVTVDGSGGTITVGQKGYVQVPYACTITGWRIITNATGTLIFDVDKAASGTIPTLSITGSAPPTLGAGQQTTFSSTLTGWTTAISANDMLGFTVDSAATVSWAVLQLFVTKS